MNLEARCQYLADLILLRGQYYVLHLLLPCALLRAFMIRLLTLIQDTSEVIDSLATVEVLDPEPLVVTLALTPSFFPWAQSSSAVISKILNKTFFADHLVAAQDIQVDVIVAIVDRVFDFKSLSGPRISGGDGEEGISVLVSRQKHPLEDTVFTNQPTISDDREDTMTIEQKDCLSIAVAKNESHQFNFSIPLANTVFQNGQKSTLIASQWLASSGTRHFTIQQEKRLRSYTVELPEEEPFGCCRMSIPLKPLTVPRRIAASTGNIIRKIYMDEHDTSAAPASQELEMMVTEHFKSNNSEPHRVSVWALLWTSEILQRYEASFDGKESNLDDVARFIQSGASLHRVLSGGGGWGHKQGLLSIDPERTYSTSDTPGSKVEDSGLQALFGSNMTSGGWVEMTHPGDFVRFFVTDSAYEPPGSDSTISDTSGEFSMPTTVCFRVMASNIDDMPVLSKGSGSSTHIKPRVIDNLFSAQSHQGICQQIKISESDRDHDNILSKLLSTDDNFTTYETKLDAPFSFIEARKDIKEDKIETIT
jgi:hypothetical protein